MFSYCILPIFCPKPQQWLGDALGKSLQKNKAKRRLTGLSDGRPAGRQLREASDSMLASQMEEPMTLPATVLKSGTVTLFALKKTVFIVGIPVQFEARLYCTYDVSLTASLNILDRELSVALIPSIAVVGEVRATPLSVLP